MLKIKNWSQWQSYRTDRGTPPWIKIHRNILSNKKWAVLTDAQKGQIVSLWVVAADNDGELPSDPRVLKKICMLDHEPDLQLFVNIGFLECDVNVTSTWRQHDAPETETETDITISLTDNNLSYQNKSLTDNIRHKCQKYEKPDDVPENVWEDFLTHRKAKRAPVTKTVIENIRREAAKIGWTVDMALAEICARGWQGFKSDWVLRDQGKPAVPDKKTYSDVLQDAARQAVKNLERTTGHEIY